MSLPYDALVQAQQQLDRAQQYVRKLRRELETQRATLDGHKAAPDYVDALDLDSAVIRIAEIEIELDHHRREILPDLKAAVRAARAQQLIDQVSKPDNPLLNDHQAKVLAATRAGEFRRALQETKQQLERNTQSVAELIDTVQSDPGIQDNEHVSFPAPGQVIIHGVTYSTTGPDDLHFLTQRALQRTWSN